MGGRSTGVRGLAALQSAQRTLGAVEDHCVRRVLHRLDWLSSSSSVKWTCPDECFPVAAVSAEDRFSELVPGGNVSGKLPGSWDCTSDRLSGRVRRSIKDQLAATARPGWRCSPSSDVMTATSSAIAMTEGRALPTDRGRPSNATGRRVRNMGRNSGIGCCQPDGSLEAF
jgi:hypothetical protein